MRHSKPIKKARKPAFPKQPICPCHYDPCDGIGCDGRFEDFIKSPKDCAEWILQHGPRAIRNWLRAVAAWFDMNAPWWICENCGAGPCYAGGEWPHVCMCDGKTESKWGELK